MIRFYCARYYGPTSNLHGRMLVLMVRGEHKFHCENLLQLFAWVLVSLYIIDTFIQFGISLRCGGHVQRPEPLPTEYVISVHRAMKLV